MARPALKLDPACTTRLCCSMCGRSDQEVRYLMAGTAGGHLCDACTYAAMKIVVRQRVREAFTPAGTSSAAPR